MTTTPSPPRVADSPEERYRLYVDESGDHVFEKLDNPAHRYLCLLGCWFQGRYYRPFHDALVALKTRHIPHNPDDPVVLHREDLINRRGPFWRLRDPEGAAAFDKDLLAVIAASEFRVVAIVIDKLALKASYETPAHPYHLALGFLLQRYCGYLNHVNRQGDVMAESRGGREDRLLKDSYQRHYEHGAWMLDGAFFQQALTSRELKLKPKSADISGLQLADLLGHPVKQAVLIERRKVAGPLASFAGKLWAVVQPKLNRHLNTGRIEGYGWVLFPK